MRNLLWLGLFAVASCTSHPSIAPREYLDEETAATITVVARPWIFSRKDASPQVDFFHLYAIDVNRMGDHRKYFALIHYWPGSDLAGPGQTPPTLVLAGGGRELRLEAAREEARQIGLGQPLDSSAPSSSRSWFYPIECESLRPLAQSRDLTATLVTGRVRAEYALWRDGSSELSEFTATFEAH